MTLGMCFGNMSYENSMRTQRLFTKEVLPRIKA